MSRPSGRSGSYTGLVGFNPRWLKGAKKGDELRRNTPQCLCEIFFPCIAPLGGSGGGGVNVCDWCALCVHSCAVLEPFPSARRTHNTPEIGSSLTLRCTPPTCFPHPKIFWAVITSDNRFSPVDYSERVTIDPIGTVRDASFFLVTLRASCGAVYCNWSCLFVGVCVCGWVSYHDNSKLRASILTKLGL